MKKVGILGGTFDPVHLGHLMIAKQAKQELQLDEMYLMPTGKSPHKEDNEITRTTDRLAMLRLALKDEKELRLSTYEVDNGMINYSYLTLQMLSEEHPDDELYFVMGADSLFHFSTWKHPKDIAKHATLAVAVRDDLPIQRIMEEVQKTKEAYDARIVLLHSPKRAISSHEIRSRIHDGLLVDDMLPKEVYRYILEHKLYL